MCSYSSLREISARGLTPGSKEMVFLKKTFLPLMNGCITLDMGTDGGDYSSMHSILWQVAIFLKNL